MASTLARVLCRPLSFVVMVGCAVDPASGAGALSGGGGGDPSDPGLATTDQTQSTEGNEASVGSSTGRPPADETTTGESDSGEDIVTTGEDITTTGGVSSGSSTIGVASTTEDDSAQECPTEEIDGDGPWVAFGETSGASLHGGSCGGDSAPEAIHAWTPTVGGTYLIGVEGSDFDTVLYLLEGTCDGLELACNDDGGEPNVAQLEVTVSAFETYLVVVDGNPNQDGGYVLFID